MLSQNPLKEFLSNLEKDTPSTLCMNASRYDPVVLTNAYMDRGDNSSLLLSIQNSTRVCKQRYKRDKRHQIVSYHLARIKDAVDFFPHSFAKLLMFRSSEARKEFEMLGKL